MKDISKNKGFFKFQILTVWGLTYKYQKYFLDFYMNIFYINNKPLEMLF